MWNPPDPYDHVPEWKQENNEPPFDWTELNAQELAQYLIDKLWEACAPIEKDNGEDIPF